MKIEDITFVSKDFYQRHSKKIFCVIVLLILYINLRYECDEALFRINKLKRELADTRYTSIARWGELTGKNKPETVRRKVAESHVRLITSDEPPTVIE